MHRAIVLHSPVGMLWEVCIFPPAPCSHLTCRPPHTADTRTHARVAYSMERIYLAVATLVRTDRLQRLARNRPFGHSRSFGKCLAGGTSRLQCVGYLLTRLQPLDRYSIVPPQAVGSIGLTL